jgi:GH18 family chitinase
LTNYVDIWNIASYDYISPTLAPDGTIHSGHSSNYLPSNIFNNPRVTPYNTDAAVAYYFGKGVELSKMTIGVPLYVTQFHETDGPGTTSSYIDRHPLDTFPPEFFEDIKHDRPAMAAFIYDKSSKVMTSLECVATVDYKADVVKNGTLGGIAWIKAIGQKNGTLIHHVRDTRFQRRLPKLTATGRPRSMGRRTSAVSQYITLPQLAVGGWMDNQR